MRFQSSVVVEALQGLERQFGTPRGYLAQVASLVSGGQFEAAREATDKVLRALDVVIATKVRLHANVVPVDDLGQSVESLGELAFRARRMVIVTQLNHLCDVLREPAAQERARCWFVGRFQGIGDVATFFRDELSRINRMWTQYREGHEHAAGISSTNRAILYRASVRAAQGALRDLGEHPDLAYILRAGFAVDDWPEVHTAFAEIVAALAVQIDVESGRQLFVPLPPSHTSESPPARKP